MRLKIQSPLNCLETSYVTTTIYIDYIESWDDYSATGFDLHEQSAY
ncbi:MAG: hypothetical protein KBT88_13255 [Gammaproteobacteria bacterium]|nr:hypothetical protein [Gammaproteobacteria bacterium]MBQ0840745.1 hypothetical protein [Gammaproteobacteria bacterium]